MQKQTKNSSRTWILLLVLALLLSLSGCQEEAHPGLSSQPPEELLPKNDYDLEAFSEQNGFLTYDDGTRTANLGVDVSVYQGQIDWQAVREAGVEFAIIRLGLPRLHQRPGCIWMIIICRTLRAPRLRAYRPASISSHRPSMRRRRERKRSMYCSGWTATMCHFRYFTTGSSPRRRPERPEWIPRL